MAKKKVVKAASRSRASSARAPRASAVRAPKTINVSMAPKGDLSLPSAKGDKKKLLYVAVAAVVLVLAYLYFTGGIAFAGELWPS